MAKAKTAAAAVKETEEAPVKESRNVGITSGLRIGEYQNQTLAAQVKQKLTDEELAADWHREFPKAMDFTERVGMVGTVRSLYNKGKHKNDVPAAPIHEYDAEGNKLPIPARGRKTKQEAVQDEVAAPATAKVPVKPTAKAAVPAAAPAAKKFVKK